MTLPTQPGSPAQVRRSQEFYRLKQPVLSAGAIYEIDSSARAIYIGPDSDLAEVRLGYFNPDADALNDMVTADVSVNGPIVGRLDSLLDQQYGGLNQEARIIAYPVDIVDPTYQRPTGPLAVPARRENVAPQIDLMVALKELPSIPAVRADRTLRFPRVPFNNDAGVDNDGSTDLVIPIYGRRMVTVQIITPVGVGHVMSFFIAALQPGFTSFPKFLGSITKAGQSITDTDSVVFRASDQYNLDEITGVGNTSAPSTFDYTENAGMPLPKCKGMADLLIINIAPNFEDPPPPGYSLVDLFIKLSDREE